MRDFLTFGHNALNVPNSPYGGVWDGFRSEGRFSVNIGVGLAESGFSVDINSSWRTWPFQNVTSNLRLTNNKPETYRHAMAFSNWDFLRKTVADNLWMMFYSNPDVAYIEGQIKEHEIDMSKVKFCIPYKPTYDAAVEDGFKYELHYFPTVFPLPLYSKEFLPHSIDFSKHVIRLYLQTAIFNEFTEHYPALISAICQSFNRLGFEVHLYLQTNCQREFLTHKDFHGWRGNVSFVQPMVTYYDLYQFISRCDFGVLFLEPPSAAGSQFDFISLGKPVLAFEQGDVRSGGRVVSPLMQNLDLIYGYDTPVDKDALFEYIKFNVENADVVLGKFQDSMRDYEYETWKSIVLPLLGSE